MLRLWKRNRTNEVVPPPRRELFSCAPHRFQRASYLQAVAIVAAKLAKCDGPVNRSEIDCFKRLFPLAEQEQAAVAPLFDLARDSADGFEPFAAELVRMLGEEPAERLVLFERLVHVAEADGVLNAEEQGFLDGLARALGVEGQWEALRSRPHDGEEDPYAVLGVGSDISDQALREVWHRLIRRFHPDALAARGEEGGDHSQVAAINAAYRRIRRARRKALQA